MTARRVLVRVAQVVVAGAIALSAAACTCPSPNEVDQTFVLDDTGSAPIDLIDAGFSPLRDAGADAAASRDASDAAASSDAATSSDAVMSTFRGMPDAASSSARDCTSAAAGCAPGGDCEAACTCVLSRAAVYDGTIQRCTLIAGATPPQVRVRYSVPVFCPGG